MGLARRIEKRAVSYQDFWGRDYESSVNIDQSGLMWYGNRTFSGINVTQERALRATAVWACVSIIADSISGLPWETFRRNALGVRQTTDLPSLLLKPHPEMTRFEWLQRAMTSLLLDGNAYMFIARDGNGNVISLTPIHPYRIDKKRAEGSDPAHYMVDGSDRIELNEILHIKGFTRPGDLTGMSPIGAAKEAVGLSLVAEEFGARFFGQGAQSSGVLETPADLTDNAATVMAKQFQEKHGGSKKAHLPLVLTGGAQWKPLSIPPNEAQFLETRQFQAAEIARLYRVPLHLIQELDKGTSWGTGIEQQNIAFVRYTLMPWLVRIEEALSELLPGRLCVKFNVDEFQRATMFERYQSFAIGLTNGFLNKDEVRAIEDLPPLPDGIGQTHLQPLNLGPAGNPDENGDSVGKAAKKLFSMLNDSSGKAPEDKQAASDPSPPE